MSAPIDPESIRLLAARWRQYADRLEAEANEAAANLELGSRRPEPPSIAALRREASTYRAGALELDALLLSKRHRYATTETLAA